MPMPDRSGVTIDRLRKARTRYVGGEPRDLFYRAALVLIAASANPPSELDLAESLAVLLLTWNTQFYRFRGGFTQARLLAIRELLDHCTVDLNDLRTRRLDTLTEADKTAISRTFHAFEIDLGPVGAAKALHLLAPEFFPIWDDAIAKKAYRIYFKRAGGNSDHYLRLMRVTAAEIEGLGGWDAFDGNPIKAIDEYNYCVYTQGWELS